MYFVDIENTLLALLSQSIEVNKLYLESIVDPEEYEEIKSRIESIQRDKIKLMNVILNRNLKEQNRLN